MRLDPLKLGPCVSVSILGGGSFTWQIIFTPPDNLCTPTTTKDKAKLLFCQAWLFNGFVKKKKKKTVWRSWRGEKRARMELKFGRQPDHRKRRGDVVFLYG